jgi:hypothetical protein
MPGVYSLGMAKKRRRPLAVLISILIVTAALAAGLWIWYAADRRDPFGYLPGSFLAYVQLTSLRSAYDDWIGQESIERALAAAGFGFIRKAVVDLRGAQASKSSFLRSLLDVRADLAVLKDGSVVGALSLGPRSLVTRVAPVAGPLISLKGLSFIKESGFSSFEYDLGGVKVYAAPAGDLLIIATKRETLQAAFRERGGGSRLSARTDLRTLEALSGTARGVRFLVDTRTILSAAISGIPAGKRLLETLDFPAESVADLRPAEPGLELELDLPVKAGAPEVDEILASSGGRSKLLPILPPSASFCLGFNFRELSLAFKALEAVEPGLSATLAKADEAAKSVLGYGFDGLLFSWAGGEAALLQAGGSTSPVLCLSVRDEKLRQERLGRALSLPVFNRTEQDWDGARLTRVSFPWWVEALLDAADIKIDNPYLAVAGGFFLVSQDPESLAAIVKGIDSGQRLREGRGWADVLPASPGSPLAYCVYESDSRPFFLGEDWPVTAILEEFGRGFLMVSPSREGLSASLRAAPAPEGSARRSSYGFPLLLGRPLDSMTIVKFKGASTPRIAAIGRETLWLIDPAAPASPLEISVPKGSLAASGAGSRLWTVDASGQVCLRGKDGSALDPFPVPHEESRMPPLAIETGLLLYSESRKGLSLVDEAGSVAAFGPQLEDPVFASPVASGGLVAWATKGFDSLVYLSNDEGMVRAGWPQEGGGISFGSPALSSSAEGVLVGFLCQSGRLSLWSGDGKTMEGFPMELEGVFYTSPVICLVGHERILACADEEGGIRLVSEYTTVYPGLSLPEAAGKKTRLTAADRDGDGRDELYVSGNANMVFGYTLPGLALLPGFPMPGSMGPAFADIDNDGALEAVSASADGSIQAR